MDRESNLLEIKARISHDNLVCIIEESEKYSNLSYEFKIEFLTQLISDLANKAKLSILSKK
jgi:hypothetical protein